MTFILDFATLVEASPQACPLLNVSDLGLVADVAGAPAGPVHVSALGTLPVLGREQTFAFFCSVLPYFDAELLLAALAASVTRSGLLRLASVALVTSGKVDIAT